MNNKVAIVTGASSGIGRATARLFAEKGATVVGVGRSEKELYAVRDELKDAAGSIRPHLGDVWATSQLDRIVNETVDSFGQIDILVNAAGILKGGSIEDCSLSDWDKQMHLNVRSVFYLMQKCIPHLEATKGSIVNVSSVTGTRAFPG